MESLSTRAKALYAEELLNLKALRASSMKTAALVCRTFPPAILAGLGIRPVRIPFGISDLENKETKSLVRPDVCPLALELLEVIQSDCSDLLIGMHTCDTTRRLFQESSRFTSLPVHQIQLPATITELSSRFFTKQVERVVHDLILGGFSKGYDPDVAAEWYTNTLEAAKFLRSRMRSIPPVALQYFFHLFRIADPGTIIGKMENLLSDFRSYKPEFTILLTGSPVTPGDDTVAEIIEEMGGALIPVNCTGFQMFPEAVPNEYSPSSISEAYFSSMKCVRCRPNERTFEYLIDEVSRASADGLIVKSLSFCDFWFSEKVRMKERIPVPVLILDSGFSKGEKERTTVRVEAFIQAGKMAPNE